jgi:hypothetical protein
MALALKRALEKWVKPIIWVSQSQWNFIEFEVLKDMVYKVYS